MRIDCDLFSAERSNIGLDSTNDEADEDGDGVDHFCTRIEILRFVGEERKRLVAVEVADWQFVGSEGSQQ